MEGSHGKLCTRLANGLCRDNTNSLAHLYRLSGRHVSSVALRAHAVMRFTGKDGTDLNLLRRFSIFIHTIFHNSLRTFWSNHMICFYDNITVFIMNILAQEASCNTFLKAFNLFISIHECLNIHSGDFFPIFTAVNIMNNHVLGNINHSSGQVSGIGSTQSRI